MEHSSGGGGASLEGGAPIQHVHQHFTRGGIPYIITAVNGEIYRDDMSGGTPEKVSNAEFSTSEDAQFQMVDYHVPGERAEVQPEIGVYITDGENPMGYLPDMVSPLALMSTVSDQIPGFAGTVGVLKEHVFWGDFQDFGPGRVHNHDMVIHSDPGEPFRYLGTSGARNTFNRRRKIVSLIENDTGDIMLAMLAKGIHYIALQPALQTGQARTNFYYDQLSGTEGLVGKNAWVSTPVGTFFFGRRGLYHVGEGVPPPKPRYVGKPIEKFWKEVLSSGNVDLIQGADLPEISCAMFACPHGKDQVRNNRGLFFNYESWTQWGQDRNDLHPAFCVYRGNDVVSPFEYNSLAYIEDTDGFDRIVGGDYDGKLWTIGSGFLDRETEAIRMRCRTPAIGTPHRENHWITLILDITLDSEKTVTVYQRNYDRPAFYSEIDSKGPGGLILDSDSAILDSAGAILGGEGDAVAPVRFNLKGQSCYTDIEIVIDATEGFELHGIRILAEPGESVL